MPQSTVSEFPAKFARQQLHDLFTPRQWIYWIDFGLTYVAGVYCFLQVRGGSLLQPHQGFQWTSRQLLFFAASCLLFYRASMFIHEVVHQRVLGRLLVFRFVWNLLCGIPFLIPSFVYYTHIDHHRRNHFGTEHDGEYLPLEHQPWWQIMFYLSWCLVIPPLAFFRFLVLTPLAWTIPGLRGFVHKHMSSMVMDPSYIRPLPSKRSLQLVAIQEAGCFLWCLAIISYAPITAGRLPIPFLIHAYAMAVIIILLNSIRTLGAHRWSNDGGELTFDEQLLDSVNYPNHAWLSEIWGPVGTRYHALHHLFPSLPYHALPAAHRRLTRALPADSLYRQTEEMSLTAALWHLWQRNRQSNRDKAAVASSGRKHVA